MVLISLISISLGATDESHISCKVLNGLPPFVFLHVFERFPFVHERKSLTGNEKHSEH